MFDISKLPKPDLIIEHTLEEKIETLKAAVQEELPEWSAVDSDPMMKVLKAVAMKDCLREQRINDTARRLLVAFARGNDLDNIRPDIQRLPGGNATCKVKLTIGQGSSGVIPSGLELRDDTGELKAKTFQDYTVPETDTASGDYELTVEAQVYEPAGAEGNGISGKFNNLLIASAIIDSVSQSSASTGGTDPESDERYIQRILLAPTANMGGRRSYEYLVLSADANIKDVKIRFIAPGQLDIRLLSSEGDGTADAQIVANVEDALDDETLRPMTDVITVESAEIVKYSVAFDVWLWPGTSQSVYAAVKNKAISAVKSLHRIGKDVTKYTLWGMSAAEGVAKVDITILNSSETSVDSVDVDDTKAAYCTNVTVNEKGFWLNDSEHEL